MNSWFIIIISLIAVIGIINWIYGIITQLIIPNWSKIVSLLQNLILGVGATIGFILIIYLYFFRGCSESSYHDTNHIHYERFHRY